MTVPSSTYRIQFHKGFTLRDLQRITEYLHTLGVDTVYASPLTCATPGSMHGYDVTDPHLLNPELGTPEDLWAVVKDLRKKDMLWLQDIVPNHMAFHPSNTRLMDVLERGPDSPWYRYFDIEWNHGDPDLKGKVMTPFLGKDIDACIKEGEIALRLTDDGIRVMYFDTAYPLSSPAYGLLADIAGDRIQETVIPVVLRKVSAAATGTDLQTWVAAKQSCCRAIAEDKGLHQLFSQTLATLSRDHAQLEQLLEAQYYRLCFWKEADRRINYRRFFTVNELICLRMEDPHVFEEYHRMLFSFFHDKLIDGFRIDHVDGLQDPGGYTRALRARTGEDAYIIVEKILEAREEMPSGWPIQGTSGYEFLSFLNRLLTNRKGGRSLLNFYRDLVPDVPPYPRLIFESKRLILEHYLRGEWENLLRLFRASGFGSNFSDDRLKTALGLFMLSLPVYRIYPETLPLKGKMLVTMHQAFDRALAEDPDYRDELLYLRSLFTSVPSDEDEYTRLLRFLKRVMQFTGPLTAKGVEDTAFYLYNPLISHDEVGDAPAPLSMTVARFHEKMRARQATAPLSLNATATHDTKRGEDARTRLNVLSRIPGLWIEQVREWLDANKPFRTRAGYRTAPQFNDEYFIYQSLLGGFPEDFQVTPEWIKRVRTFVTKALREGKANTTWSQPDTDYEEACLDFIDNILHPGHSFLPSLTRLAKMVSEHAMVYSLTQTLIKTTAPGIPDIYQGCELWDFSFVDPDNRRPVDFDKRMQFLFQLVVRQEGGKEALFDYLRQYRAEGIEKLYVIWRTLNFRRGHPDLFTEGVYVPVEITGPETRAAAYARTDGTTWAIVVFPFGLVRPDAADATQAWDEQFLILPEDAPEAWYNLFTGERLALVNALSLSSLFADFPVAMLVSDTPAV